MRILLPMIRRIIELRSKARREIYVFCGFVVGLFGLFAMEEGVVGILPFAVVFITCIVQFFRPTLLCWFLITAAFSAYTIGLLATRSGASSLFEFTALLLIWLVPSLVLLWCWPKPLGRTDPPSN
jgi:hypothetical protein